MSKPTLSNEEINSILTAVAEKVQAAIDEEKEVTVDISNPAFSIWHKIKSCELDETFKIQFTGTWQPLEIEPSKFLGCEELDPSPEYYKPTLFFDGITVEIEAEK